MRWLDALAKKARPDDDTSVADRMAEAYEASSRGDYARALEIWGPLAHAGVARAQNNVGACFTEGLGVERDPKLALQWLSLAAAAGDAVGQRNCAALYFKGEGVEQDFLRALELYRAAAEQDDGAGAGHAELDAARRRSHRARLRRRAANSRNAPPRTASPPR